MFKWPIATLPMPTLYLEDFLSQLYLPFFIVQETSQIYKNAEKYTVFYIPLNLKIVKWPDSQMAFAENTLENVTWTPYTGLFLRHIFSCTTKILSWKSCESFTISVMISNSAKKPVIFSRICEKIVKPWKVICQMKHGKMKILLPGISNQTDFACQQYLIFLHFQAKCNYSMNILPKNKALILMLLMDFTSVRTQGAIVNQAAVNGHVWTELTYEIQWWQWSLVYSWEVYLFLSPTFGIHHVNKLPSHNR